MSHTEHLWKRACTLRFELSQQLDEIYLSDYPTSSPRDLIEFIQAFLTKLRDAIDENKTDFRYLSWICQTIQQYGKLLPDLEGASTAQTPRALVLLLNDLISELYPNSTLIAYPRQDYNYSIVDILPFIKDSLVNLLSQSDVEGLLKGFHGPLNIISFPRIERDNILDHAVFGHELGHPIADAYLGSEEKSSPDYQRALDEYTSKVRERVQQQIAHEGKREGATSFDEFKITSQLIEQLLEIRRRGLEELISDCVSVLLFGPSALFATYDIFLATNIDSELQGPEYYPPSRYRLRVMKKLLDAEGYTEQLRKIKTPKTLKTLSKSVTEFLADIDIWIASPDDTDQLKQHPIAELAYEWIDSVLSDAIAYAKNEAKKITYPPEKISAEVGELVERLSLGIPPNERGAYPDTANVDWRSAIVAGWLYKLVGFSLPFRSGQLLTEEDIDRLSRLTLRAVELQILSSKYSANVGGNPN